MSVETVAALLGDPWLWSSLLLGAFALGSLALIAWASVSRATLAQPTDQGGAPAALADARLARKLVRESFGRATALVGRGLGHGAQRYRIPWIAVLRVGDSAPLALTQAGMRSVQTTAAAAAAGAPGLLHWDFLAPGVVAQVATSPDESDEPDAAGNEAWDEFLDRSLRFRPDRPLDSIVLAVPAALLAGGDARSSERIAQAARVLQKRLWLTQKRLALRLPVYLIVSDAHSLPGFSELAAAAPGQVRDRMLGWSSPYALDAAFQLSWVDQAVAAIAEALADLGTEAAAQADVVDASLAEAFLLPRAFEGLRPGLQRFAQELMKDTAYHEPFTLRGIYLCGDAGEAAALLASTGDSAALPLEDAAAAALIAQPAFLRDLFERKIFAEWGQIRPIADQPLRRPRAHLALRAAQVAVPAVWLVGLVVHGTQLGQIVEQQMQAIRKLNDDDRRLLRLQAGAAPGHAPRTMPLHELAAILPVDASRMASVFMPGSWGFIDPLNARVQERIESGVRARSFDAMLKGLQQRLSALTGAPLDEETGRLLAGAACGLPAGWREHLERGVRGGIAVEDTAPFLATLDFIGQIERLDAAVQAFERLHASNQPPAAADYRIVATTLGIALPENVDRLAELFRRSAAKRKVDLLERFQAAAGCSFSRAIAEVHREIFDDNDLVLLEQSLVELAARVEGGSARAGGLQAQIDDWRELLAVLRQQEELLVPGKGAWMRSTEFQLGPAYDDLLRRTSAISILGPRAAADARRLGLEGYTRFQADWRAALEGFEKELGPLAWSDREGRWVWGPERVGLRAALNDLLGQSFMSPPPAREFRELSPQAAYVWDRARLDQALAVADIRKRVQAEVLPRVPGGFRDDIARIVDAALAANAIDLAAQAAAVAPRAVNGGFGDAERSRLSRLNVLLLELGARADADRLASVLARESAARLRAVDEAFRRSDVYAPRERDFRSWTGEKGPLFAAYGVSDPAGMAAYLQQQQARVEALAREAEPNLPIVESVTPGNPFGQRWQAVLTDLERYRLKSPNSTLALLEQFMLSGAADIERGNCLEKLGRPAPSRSLDPFAERLSQLQIGLLARCRELRAAGQKEAWTQFASVFNRDLAGRPPFVGMPPVRPADAQPPTPPVSPAQAMRQPADAEDLLAVLRAFERAHRALADTGVPRSTPQVTQLRRFDEQMERVRAFLAPLFPTEEGAVGGYDLQVEFRANQAAEAEGSAIIEWSLAVGPQTLRHRDPPRPLRWEPGMPVTLSLRLARDAPVRPMADPAQPAILVDDRTVSYRYQDPWALLGLVQRHREPEAGSRGDGRSQLLRFEFPLQVVAELPALAPAASRARVYLRMVVSAAGKRTPLVWPGYFPAQAPDWSGP